VSIEGAKESDHYFLVRGQQGYRCAVEGSIDGAPCNLSEHIVPTTFEFVPAANPVKGPLDATMVLEFSGEVPPADTNLHLINGSAPPGKRYQGQFTMQDSMELIMPLIADSAMAQVVEGITVRPPGQCGVTADPCSDLDLLRDYSPPLENELSQHGGDPSVEDSWRHFLMLARAAADEADRLGEQLVQTGLDMDIKADAARKELEEICGDVVNIPDVDTTQCTMDGANPDPSCDVVSQYLTNDATGLHACLPPELGGKVKRDFVSLGGKACIFRWKKQGLCSCPEGLADCESAPCPAKADPGDESDEDCKDQFGFPANGTWTDPEDPENTVEVILVDNALGIFESTDRGDKHVSWDTAQALLDELEEAISDRTLTSDKEAFHIWFSNWLSRPGNQWINLYTLKMISNALKLDVDFLHHYTLSSGGMVLFTTRVTHPDDCPKIAPWSDDNEKIDCVRPGSNPLEAPAHGQGLWLFGELDTDIASLGYAWRRAAWGRRVKQWLFWLGALTGDINNFRDTKYALSNSSGDLSYLGEQYSGLITRELVPEITISVDPLICLETDVYEGTQPDLMNIFTESWVEADPNISPCGVKYSDENGPMGPSITPKYGFRYEYTSDYAVRGDSAQFAEFWRGGIEDFLSGRYQTGSAWHFDSRVLPSLEIESLSNSGDGHMPMFKSSPDDWTASLHRHDDRWFYSQWRYNYELTRHDFVKLLRFAAYFFTQNTGASTECNIENAAGDMPRINDVADIRRARDHVTCVANSIHQIGERLVIPNLPVVLAEGYRTSGLEGYYPNYQGENLKTLLALEADLKKFGNATAGVADTLRRVSGQLSNLYLASKQYGIQGKINALQTAVNVVGSALQGMSSIEHSTNPWTAAGYALGYAAIATMQQQIGEYQDQLLEYQEEQTFNDAMIALGDQLTALRGLYNDIFGAMESIQANLATLDQLQNRASRAFADMLFLDSDTAGHVLNVNTVMRRRHNTIRERYQKALKRARKLAFVARRAIELRLGVNMSKMTDPMTLVPPPAKWVDRLCEMQGFDYQKLRDAYPDDPLLDPKLQESDSYSHWYVGDYVRRLEDFVESYNFDFPFSDEHDVAVVSLRDDIMALRESCEVESYNLLYHGGEVGMATGQEVDGTSVMRGWVARGCVPGEGCLSAVPDSNVSVPATAMDTASSAMRLSEPVFEEVTVNGVTGYSRGQGWVNSGYYVQTVQGVVPGQYMFSWHDLLPEDNPSAPMYRVEVRDVGLSPGLEGDFVGLPTPNQWTRREPIRFQVDQTTDLEIRIYPSDATGDATAYDVDPSSVVFGDVLIWGAQLEWVHPSRCGESGGVVDCSQTLPLWVQVTSSTRNVQEPACSDLDGDKMRSEFRRGCICLDQDDGVCPDNAQPSDYRRCYYEYAIPVTLDAIDQGTLIPSNNIALNNFNYRQEAFAVNIVGTNVVDCTQPWSTSTCYTNAFVPYTLEHQGSDLPVRNHSRDTEQFTLHTARVEHGKGLAAEVVLTNPLTSNHTQLLTEYWKDGLRGRPFQGSYVLRIWETPDMDWRKVEDIQLVWRYRYWTQMSGQ
jgi:hypothetical protein